MENAKSDNTKAMEKAVDSAAKYFVEMMKAFGTEISNARLEEIIKSKDGQNWEITLSYIDPTSASPLSGIYGAKESNRIYKIIKIDATNFEAISMKNR